ncbi:MAG: transglycosylase SLT domain-containing protein [Patescibacteria group bacterium]|nr:transglycosylase SLT domain-containing protein [Patescibacteria group bacterium]
MPPERNSKSWGKIRKNGFGLRSHSLQVISLIQSGSNMGFIPTGSILTNAQLQQLWVGQGGDPNAAATAAAIAQAESGGNTQAIGYYSPSLGYDTPSPTSDTSQVDEGAWQIANIHAGATGSTVVPSLLDPSINAKFAIWVSNNGQNFGPWSQYKNGTYLQYLQPNINSQQNPVGSQYKSPANSGSPFQKANPGLEAWIYPFLPKSWQQGLDANQTRLNTLIWIPIAIVLLLAGLAILAASHQNVIVNTAKGAAAAGALIE